MRLKRCIVTCILLRILCLTNLIYMRNSLILTVCFLFLSNSINIAESPSNENIDKKKQINKWQSIIEKDNKTKEYLKTLKIWEQGKYISMLDKFPFESRMIVADSCFALEINTNDFYRLVHFESRGNTKARHKKSKATGLIQWTKSTAKLYGTSIDELYNMTLNEQLAYAFRYLRNANNQRKFDGTYNDLYLSVFYPSARGKKKDHVITDMTTKIGKNEVLWNAQFDLNKDSVITVSELLTYNQ